MSDPVPNPRTVIVRADEAEKIGGGNVVARLLIDSPNVHGALSTQRITLKSGAHGATPHVHRGSTELFYILDGTVQVLAGDDVVVVQKGDVIAVPAGTCHAFAAAAGRDADLLIVITPGVERFEYFRHLARIARGELPPASILEVQERYDTFFEESTAWAKARTPG